MTDDEKACLLGLAREGLDEPVWINRVAREDVCPVHGHQLFMPPWRARPACLALEAKGLVESDGKERWTMVVWITEKGLKKISTGVK